MITQHVTPMGDQREHVEDVLCPCMPRTLAMKCDDGSQGRVVVHNSYDGRECGEVFFSALTRLAGALIQSNGRLTEHQREAYEHARTILMMHWPDWMPPKLPEDA